VIPRDLLERAGSIGLQDGMASSLAAQDEESRSSSLESRLGMAGTDGIDFAGRPATVFPADFPLDGHSTCFFRSRNIGLGNHSTVSNGH
jgi:hypothetical protein